MSRDTWVAPAPASMVLSSMTRAPMLPVTRWVARRLVKTVTGQKLRHCEQPFVFMAGFKAASAGGPLVAVFLWNQNLRLKLHQRWPPSQGRRC
jgi:hypothetical protein